MMHGELDIADCGVRWCDWSAIKWSCCWESWGDFEEVVLLEHRYGKACICSGGMLKYQLVMCIILQCQKHHS